MHKAGRNIILILLPLIAIALIVYAFGRNKPTQAIAMQPAAVAAPLNNHPLYRIKVPENALAVVADKDPRYVLIGSGVASTVFMNGIPQSMPGTVTLVDASTWKPIRSIKVADPVYGIVASNKNDNFCLGIPSMSDFGTHYAVPSLIPIKPTEAHPLCALANISFSEDQAVLTWGFEPSFNGRKISRTLPANLQDTAFVPRRAGPIAFSQDCKSFAATDSIVTNLNTDAYESFIYIIDTATGRDRQVLKTPEQNAITFIPHSNRLATITGDGLVHYWDPTTWSQGNGIFTESPVWSSAPSAGTFDAIIASPDGKEVLTASNVHYAVWNAKTGKLLANVYDDADFPASGSLFRERVTFSGDSKYILIGDHNEVRIWKAPSPS